MNISKLLSSILIAFFDQLTKYFINSNINDLIYKKYLIFNIDFVKNYGAAFNLFNGYRLFLSSISLLFVFLLIYLILRKYKTESIELYSYSLILGGTIGNGIDRIIRGYVVDFINLNFIDFPVFNIADIFINIGFFLLL